MREQNIRHWSPEDDAFLRDNYTQHSHKEMADALGRTLNAVRNRCSLLALRRAAEHWSEGDLARLREWYGERERDTSMRLRDLAAELRRSTPNVARKARELGLTDQRRARVARNEQGLRPCDVKRLPL